MYSAALSNTEKSPWADETDGNILGYSLSTSCQYGGNYRWRVSIWTSNTGIPLCWLAPDSSHLSPSLVWWIWPVRLSPWRITLQSFSVACSVFLTIPSTLGLQILFSKSVHPLILELSVILLTPGFHQSSGFFNICFYDPEPLENSIFKRSWNEYFCISIFLCPQALRGYPFPVVWCPNCFSWHSRVSALMIACLCLFTFSCLLM